MRGIPSSMMTCINAVQFSNTSMMALVEVWALVINESLAARIGHLCYKSDRIINFSLRVETTAISFTQVYAPQQGRPQEEKDKFFRDLQEVKGSLPYENIIVMGDLNGHVGQDRTGIEHILGAFSVGERNRDGEYIINFCL